ncbi:MAG TPA: hypothetical protein VD864_16095 [Nocardioides sp.]|nr:hypothetical protein [Nocardioides sp.]
MRARRAGSSALVAVAAAGLVSGVDVAGAVAAAEGSRAPVTVTIRADGTDLSGTVRSPRPAACAAGRTVVVFKVRGAPGGGDDVRFASDTTDASGPTYEWSTGNTGTEGRFYARLKATADCQGARSTVVRAQRSD